MNLLQLILKQMRQRSLSTLLTCLSIFLGMTLATSILILSRESRAIFAQTDYGFNLLIGPKGSPTQLVMNTIYHVGDSSGNIPYGMYEDLASGNKRSADGTDNPFYGLATWAVPYAVGDSYKGRRIVATTPQLFGVDNNGKALDPERTPHFRGTETYTFAQGRAFAASKFEAVIGWEVAQGAGLAVGSEFQATHGMPGPNDLADVHAEKWKVVGILNETHTANDRCLFIPLPTFYAIFEHEAGEEAISKIQGETSATKPAATKPAETAPSAAPEEKAYTVDDQGNVTPKLPKNEWQVSAILVQCPPQPMLRLNFILRNRPEAIGVNPAGVMADFFDAFLAPVSLLMIIISALVTILAAVSILVSIYNSVTARFREIAIMRALGATRNRILAAVCLEAGLVGLMGAIGGLFAGHLLTAAGSWYMHRILGASFPWWHTGWGELVYLLSVVGVSLLAGLVPALKAYSTPVAENLIAS